MFRPYTPLGLLNVYKQHKKEIESYVAHPAKHNDVVLSNGYTTSVFMVALLFVLLIWVWAIYSLSHYWFTIPVPIRWIALLSMFTGAGPLISLVLVYAFRNKREH